MVEGGSSKAFTVIKKMMYAEPQALHALLDKLAKSVTLYLNAQIKAGAQSVMIFDTWGGVLTGRDYQQFSLYYMHKIVDGLLRENEGRRVPVTLFTKGGGQWLEAMAETGCDALGLDWTTDIADARRRVGNKVALQGNMDPSMLYASAPRIEEEVATILAGFGQGEGHVFNLGHGIHQDVDPEHAGVFVEGCAPSVRTLSPVGDKPYGFSRTTYPTATVSRVGRACGSTGSRPAGVDRRRGRRV